MAKPKDWGWRVIPGLRQVGQYGGLPVEGHPRRCQGAIRGSNPPRQCTQWAMRGRHYCRCHGGKMPRYKRRNSLSYRDSAGEELRKKLDRFANLGPDKRYLLQEEVDLARVMAERYVKLFDKVCIQGQGDVDASMKAKVSAQTMDAIQYVADIVSKAAKVRQVLDFVVDIEHIDFIVEQVSVIIEEFVPEESVRKLINERLGKIKLPTNKEAARLRAADVRAALEAMEELVPEAG